MLGALQLWGLSVENKSLHMLDESISDGSSKISIYFISTLGFSISMMALDSNGLASGMTKKVLAS